MVYKDTVIDNLAPGMLVSDKKKSSNDLKFAYSFKNKQLHIRFQNGRTCPSNLSVIDAGYCINHRQETSRDKQETSRDKQETSPDWR